MKFRYSNVLCARSWRLLTSRFAVWITLWGDRATKKIEYKARKYGSTYRLTFKLDRWYLVVTAWKT